MLTQGTALRALDPTQSEAQLTEQLRQNLEAAAQMGALAWQAMLIRLCGNRHFAAITARLAQDLATTPSLAQALDPAFSCARDLWENKITQMNQQGQLNPDSLADMAEIVVDLEAGAGLRSERKRAAQHLRQQAERLCAQSVARILEEDLIPALISPDQQPAAEAAARAARSFGLIGQGLGVAEKYDAQMRPLIDRLINPNSELPRVERARLLEILGKNTLALEVLKGAR